jgi:hypothetical protein
MARVVFVHHLPACRRHVWTVVDGAKHMRFGRAREALCLTQNGGFDSSRCHPGEDTGPQTADLDPLEVSYDKRS